MLDAKWVLETVAHFIRSFNQYFIYVYMHFDWTLRPAPWPRNSEALSINEWSFFYRLHLMNKIQTIFRTNWRYMFYSIHHRAHSVSEKRFTIRYAIGFNVQSRSGNILVLFSFFELPNICRFFLIIFHSHF